MKRRALFGLLGGAVVAKALGLDVSAAAMESAKKGTVLAFDCGVGRPSYTVYWVSTGSQLMEWTGQSFTTIQTTD